MIQRNLDMLTRYALLSLLGFVWLTGCATTPEPTGFISDYSRLEKSGSSAMRFMSPNLRDYDGFIVDPVQIRTRRNPPVLKPEERAEVAQYMQSSLEDLLRDRDYSLTNRSGVGIGRIRVAITDATKSKWWLNLHPGSKLTGAGTGGAAMEGEIIDSITGEQLAAVIQAGRGNQFELDTFSALDDVRDVIDKWAKAAGQRLDELRGNDQN